MERGLELCPVKKTKVMLVRNEWTPGAAWLIKSIQHFYVTFHQAVSDQYKQYQGADSFPLRVGQLISAMGTSYSPFRRNITAFGTGLRQVFFIFRFLIHHYFSAGGPSGADSL